MKGLLRYGLGVGGWGWGWGWGWGVNEFNLIYILVYTCIRHFEPYICVVLRVYTVLVALNTKLKTYVLSSRQTHTL